MKRAMPAVLAVVALCAGSASAQEHSEREEPVQELWLTPLPFLQAPRELQLSLMGSHREGRGDVGGAIELGLSRRFQIGVEIANGTGEEDAGRFVGAEILAGVAGDEASMLHVALGAGAGTQSLAGRRAWAIEAFLTGSLRQGPALLVVGLGSERLHTAGETELEPEAAVALVLAFGPAALSAEASAGAEGEDARALGLSLHLIDDLEIGAGLIGRAGERSLALSLTWETLIGRGSRAGGGT